MGEEYATSKRQSCEGQKTHIWPYCVTMGKNNNPNRYYVQGWLPSHLLSHLIPWATLQGMCYCPYCQTRRQALRTEVTCLSHPASKWQGMALKATLKSFSKKVPSALQAQMPHQ